MKQLHFILAALFLFVSSAHSKAASFDLIENSDNISSVENVICAPSDDIDLYTTASASKSATEWMQAIEASLQSHEIYVKIGTYGSGTDSKWALVKADVANSLGITTRVLNHMDGVNLLHAFFPGITETQVGLITSGSLDVVGSADDAAGSFQIYVGNPGEASLILNFQLN